MRKALRFPSSNDYRKSSGNYPHSLNFWRATIVFFFLSPFLFLNFAVAQYVNTPRQNVPVSPKINGFWEKLPPGYSGNPTKKYPVIIYWHGVGEVGNGTLPSMESLLVKGVAQKIESDRFPDSVLHNGVWYPFIVLTPQYLDNTVGASDIDAMINYALANYRVDPNRVYLTGISLGAHSIYYYVGSSSIYAKKVAAIIPLAPCGGATVGHAQTIAANNVAVWGLHCEFDTQCFPSITTGWTGLINTVNGLPPTPSAVHTLTEIQNTGQPHDIFWIPFEPDFVRPPVNKNMYDWMIQYKQTNVLPVTLKDFNVRLNANRVKLEWTTAAENNSGRFIIERAGADMKFAQIATIDASVYSSAEKKYETFDNAPLSGINFYRLVQTDRDGSTQYFQTRRVLNGKQRSAIVVAPNPTPDDISVFVNVMKPERITVTLMDMHGRRIHTVDRLYREGLQEIRLSGHSLAPGNYLVSVNAGDTKTVEKIIRQ